MEQVEFSVVYDGFEADKKLAVIKLLRENMPGLGIKEAKEFVEATGVGKSIKDGMAHGAATILRDKLVAAGFKVSVK